jgi:hypothetical protein
VPDAPHESGPAEGLSTPHGRGRARVMLPVAFVVLVVLVFLLIYLVSRTGA